jgi:hypothetical protein
LVTYTLTRGSGGGAGAGAAVTAAGLGGSLLQPTIIESTSPSPIQP